MIQIYKAENTDYEKNGDMTLFPREAYVHPVLNGAWEAYLEHPIDTEGRWEYLTEDAVVKMPSFNGKQLFRIKNVKKSDSGIECDMDPIFFDAAGDCFLEDVRPTGKTGQEALDIMTASNKKYKGKSDITTGSTAYYEYKNLLEAISGDDDNSFLNRWGGEVLYDNYTVTVNERVGGDYGVSLLYGKNIQIDGFTQQIDTTNIITRIYPKAYDGYKMSGKGYVDSPLIGSYPTIHAVAITFDEIRMRDDTTTEVDDDIILCESQEELDAALKQKCEEQYAAGVDKPEVTIKADTVLLEYTQAYQDLQSLEKISLGDTVHCKHTKLNIVTDARVIELYYDSIRQRNSSVVIGDFKGNYFSRLESKAAKIDSVVREDGTVIADKVTGIIDVQNAQLRYQKNAAKRQDVRAMLFEDLDPDSELFGAMCYGTQGFQIADERTDDGRGWKWKTAFTAKGGYADSIILGLLADKTGKNFWNLDTGEFSLSSTVKVGGKTVEEISDSKVQEFVNGVYSIDFESIRKNLKNKIETWYQETDPSNAWGVPVEVAWCDIDGVPILDIIGNEILLLFEEDKTDHEGDLWKNPTDNKEYRYENGTWVEMPIPDAVFDEIDGKAQIFINTPSGPYRTGDLWFDKVSGDILTCIRERMSGFQESDWSKENRYTDDSGLNSFITAIYDPAVAKLQAQIDGQIETYYYDYEPSMQNEPASLWTTTEERKKHEGDLFYWKSKGYAYRFLQDGAAWKWQLLQDTDITKAMATAEKAQDTADHKRRVFVVEPKPPYDIGDLWVQGADGDIMRCIVAKSESAFYAVSDWDKASGYTDDTAVKEFIEKTYLLDIKKIKNSVDKKIETWYQEADPSAEWTGKEELAWCDINGNQIQDINGNDILLIAETEKMQHDGDLWHDLKNNKDYQYCSGHWMEKAVPDEVYDKIDRKTQTFLDTPVPPYQVGDLYFTGKDVLICTGARETGSYDASEWKKRDNYTDDTAVKDFISNVYTPDIKDIQEQIDGKIDTYYYDYEPTLENVPAKEWEDDETKGLHNGDLFFWKSMGYTYRFLNVDDKWNWVRIRDKDIESAMKAASDAKDTADRKRRVFISTPVPPYDAGDLWSQGEIGDLMRCKVTRSDGEYVPEDWGKASKYTDDTAVEKLNELLNQDEIFNRLTNGGTNQGLFIQDGVLYINFSFGRGGTLKLGGINNTNGLLEVYDENNELVGSWNNKGVNLKKGVISGPQIELHEMNTILGYYGDIQVMKMSNAGLAINSTDPGLGGKKVSFVMTMEPWQYTGMYIKQATSGSGAGTIIDSGFIGLGYGELKGFNPTDATMGAYGVQISTSKNNAAEAGISVLGGNIMQVSKVTGAGISTTGTKNRIANTENYSQRLLYCYEMPSPMFGDVGEAVTDETGICVVILDDIFRETIVQTDNYHVFLQKQGAGDLWIEEITESYFIVRGTENLKFSWEIKAKQSGYDSERLELFEHSTPEDEVDYEQEGYDVYREYIESKTRTGGENYENFN